MLVYKIDSTNDREGNLKEIPSEWKEQRYSLDIVKAGRGAFLGFVGDRAGQGLHTSTVEDIFIHGNTLILTTRNTVYYLKPVVEGV